MKIAKLISKDIKLGHIKGKLPSIRSLKETYNVSQATVISGLNILMSQNLIFQKKNSGYYVLYQTTDKIDNQVKFDFSTTSTAWTDFPIEEYTQCLESSFINFKINLFEYGDVQGEKQLRQKFVSILSDTHIHTRTDDIIVTNGTQQSLQILCLLLRNESILVEQPTYHLMTKLIETLNINYCIVHKADYHLDLLKFEEIVKINKPKFVYLMPRLHNPFGSTMTLYEKEVVLELSEKYDFYIIEDDYLGDFEYNSKYKTIFEMDSKDRVIYLKSFSKIMFPGQRLGIVILPEELKNNFIQHKLVSDIQTNAISQAIMYTFIESGLYEMHRQHMIDLQIKKVEIFKKSLRKYIKNLYTYEIHQLHTILKLPKNVDTKKLYKLLEEQQIKVDYYKMNYFTNYHKQEKFIKINVSNIPIENIDEGIKKLSFAIERSYSF